MLTGRGSYYSKNKRTYYNLCGGVRVPSNESGAYGANVRAWLAIEGRGVASKQRRRAGLAHRPWLNTLKRKVSTTVN